MPVMEHLTEKHERLRALLAGRGRVAVAYSGGVDSSLLAFVASRELGEGAVALTADSVLTPPWEVDFARRFTAAHGIRHVLIPLLPLAVEGVRENSPRRCYFCKQAVIVALNSRAVELGVSAIVEGSNADDDNDYRPGYQAVCEAGWRSPLKECGFRKSEVRLLSRELGLQGADRPSCACLASRIPYGTELTEALLGRVAASEQDLHSLGFDGARVRIHGDIARIELAPADIVRAVDGDMRGEITCRLRALGFAYVTLDLLGYRTGSLNEGLVF